MDLRIPGHSIQEVLKYWNPSEGDIERRVYRTERDGEACVTRVMMRPFPRQLGAMVESFARDGGRASGAPPEVLEILEGYSIRSGLPRADGLPSIVAAGLAESVDDEKFFPFVTTRWIPGKTLQQTGRFPGSRGEKILMRVLEMLRALHRESVVFGDLKPGNVVVGDAGVHLIDLDTLRQVPRDDQPTICTRYTANWSAPEQFAAVPLLYLASDVYSFGCLIAFVLTGSGPHREDFSESDLPAGWREAFAACRRHQPLDRPQVAQLLHFLKTGEGRLDRWNGEPFVEDPPAIDSAAGGLTVRVPDPAVTETSGMQTIVSAGGANGTGSVSPGSSAEVSGPDGPDRPFEPNPLEQIRTAAVQAREGARQYLHSRGLLDGARPWLMAAGAAVLLLLLSAWAVHAGYQSWQANSAADDVWSELKNFKTVKKFHTEKVLDGIVGRADDAVEIARTGEALGVWALARIWQQRWTYSSWSVQWSAARFQDGLEITDEALKGSSTPEVLLARGLLHSGACRKMPDTQPRERIEQCRESQKYLDKASARNGADSERDWLEVEIQWVALMSESVLAEYLAESGDYDGAEDVLESAAERCREIKPRLAGAPINSRELMQECLEVTGPKRAFVEYFEWVDRLIEKEKQDRGEVTTNTGRLAVHAVDSRCEDVKFSRRGNWPIADRNANGDITDLCRYVGMVALGCSPQAEDFLSNLAFRQPGAPWDEAITAARSPARTQCVLE